ncbi:protein dpy-30 homolog [Drosophila bipectinata]|uniref:protein dpy-30 homolog n=1 Tax=Drosophila bipectinata TaxID=42026 RepID=UPI0007E8362C|nr:protein dpy-30 homolog [Drosophila bipectinata]
MSQKASAKEKGRPKAKKNSVERPRKDPSAIRSILCPPIDKPKKKAKEEAKEKDCPRATNYKTADQRRQYLEQEVVPILMEGMLGLAREMPQDPITYLKKFWLQDQHKCDIDLPKDLL